MVDNHSMTRVGRAAVKQIETIPPRYQERPALTPPDFVAFTRGVHSRPEVFIHTRVRDSLAETAAGALPNEAIGLLYGRTWQDTGGFWVVVQRFIAAESGEVEASPGHCLLTAEGSANLRRRAETVHLGEEMVGWGHSHVEHQPAFSPPDLVQQARKSNDAVGLLAYGGGIGHEWTFSAYLARRQSKLSQSIRRRQDGPRQPRFSTTRQHTDVLYVSDLAQATMIPDHRWPPHHAGYYAGGQPKASEWFRCLSGC